jgi:hypothetical protein
VLSDGSCLWPATIHICCRLMRTAWPAQSAVVRKGSMTGWHSPKPRGLAGRVLVAQGAARPPDVLPTGPLHDLRDGIAWPTGLIHVAVQHCCLRTWSNGRLDSCCQCTAALPGQPVMAEPPETSCARAVLEFLLHRVCSFLESSC